MTAYPPGPYIESRDSVSRAMWHVCAALLPAVAAAVLFFGPWSLYLILGSALAAALIERPFTARGLTAWRRPLGDGSAFLAGMLFGLTLSPGSPWWIPPLGAALAIGIGKLAFGGIGHNLFNPALVARGILLLAYPGLVTAWRIPFAYDAVTQATPLDGGTASLAALFLGHVAGSIGETSAVALLVGALYLRVRGYLKWRIPVAYIAAAAITAWCLGLPPLYTILSGSLMFGALFMATDWVTSPVGRSAAWVYGIGCGVLTVLIRAYSVYPEGVTFAVLLMNGLSPLLDRMVTDPHFGEVDRRWKRRVTWAGAAVAAGILLATGYGTIRAHDWLDAYYVTGSVRRDLRDFFPAGSRYVDAYPVARDDVLVERVYAREGPAGYLVYTQAEGFYGPIRMLTVLDDAERIVGLRVIRHAESATLGGLIRRPSFLRQFLRLDTRYPELATDRLHGITGATISSRAVARAVENALRFREEPERPRTAVEWVDGDWTGTGSGYQGSLRVQVTVSNGRLTAIDVLDHRETQRVAEPAIARLSETIIERQSLDVDAISGATGTSRGLIAAIQDALSGE